MPASPTGSSSATAYTISWWSDAVARAPYQAEMTYVRGVHGEQWMIPYRRDWRLTMAL